MVSSEDDKSAMDMEKLIQQGKELGLEGKDLREFVKEQQDREREERLQQRQEKEKQREYEEREKEKQREYEEKEKQRRYELEMKRLEFETAQAAAQAAAQVTAQQRDQQVRRADEGSRAPKLPNFIDGKDDLDSYLQRFERFARVAGWDEAGWATKLAALLTGRALEVYSRLSEADATDYKKVKEACLRRYDFTEDGYRNRFRSAKPEIDESPDQFIVRLGNYLDRWIELSGTQDDTKAIKELFVREQFTNAVPRDLAVHLRERAPGSLGELAEIANHFLVAHGQKMATTTEERVQHRPPVRDVPPGLNSRMMIQCFRCGDYGHKAMDCIKKIPPHKRSYGPSKPEARDWSAKEQKAGNAIQIRQDEEISQCMVDGQLLLANGKSVPVVSNAGASVAGEKKNMPVREGKVGEHVVETLRDSGCNGVVVKKDFVQADQYTGEYGFMVLIDRTVKRVPIAKVNISCPWYTGEVTASCLPDAMYDLIVGNIDGARAVNNPDSNWMAVDAEDDEDRTEVCCTSPTETVQDRKRGGRLDEDQRKSIRKTAKRNRAVFTNKQGPCSIKKDKVALTFDMPVRSKLCTVPYDKRLTLRDKTTKEDRPKTDISLCVECGVRIKKDKHWS